MSLTGFFTRYVYIPLGGSKKGLLMTCINTMIVFLVSGIWHGANWTFILWGVLHGAFSIIDRLLGKREEKIFAPLRWFSTFAIVALLWLLFRADSIGQWKDLLVRIAGFEKMGVSKGLLSTFILPETSFIFNMLHLDHLNDCIRGLPALLTSAGAFLICLLPDNNYNRLESRNAVNMILAAGAFIWSILCLSSESVFVYFNF